MADIGYWALFLCLVVSLYGAAASFVGVRQKSRRLVESGKMAILVVAILVTFASSILLYLLITHDFQVEYVYQYTSTHLPLVYTISAFWAGEAGSLLLWLWFLAIMAAMVAQQGGNKQGVCEPGNQQKEMAPSSALSGYFHTALPDDLAI
jgi:cytochrome c-type biogenesis protein CcmF